MKRLTVPLFAIALIVSSVACHKKPIPDEPYHQPEKVHVTLDSKHIPNQRIMEMQLNLFDTKDPYSDPLIRFVKTPTSIIKLYPGSYTIAAISDYSDVVMIRNRDRHLKMEAYMENITRDDFISPVSKSTSTAHITKNGERTIGQPDRLYVANIYDINILPNIVNSLYICPVSYVITLEVEVDVTRLGSASRCRGVLSGVCPSVFIHNRDAQSDEAASVFYDARIDAKNGSINTKINLFGFKNNKTNTLYIDFLLKDGTVSTHKVDITKMITDEIRENGGQIYIKDANIELPKIETSDGGFGGDVEDWGDEDIIELPI